jgi:hypothetical protein
MQSGHKIVSQLVPQASEHSKNIEIRVTLLVILLPYPYFLSQVPYWKSKKVTAKYVKIRPYVGQILFQK